MDDGRRMQLEVFRRMTPAQRLEQGARLSACALAAWESRLRRQHPGATAAELRAIRLAEALRFSPSLPTA
jgi:hypothetical protein